MRKIFLAIAAAASLASVDGRAQQAPDVKRATATLRDAAGQKVGEATLIQTNSGVLVQLNLTNARPGAHAFHVHAVGKCEAPTFDSAGAHFNPGDAHHGYLSEKGGHAGDLPNIHVPPDGRLTIEVLARGVTLAGGERALLDSDGASLVIHEKPDDYATDPAGNAGKRIACGVITR
jgi:Cu-Zn family superoxide dismutase